MSGKAWFISGTFDFLFKFPVSLINHNIHEKHASKYAIFQVNSLIYLFYWLFIYYLCVYAFMYLLSFYELTYLVIHSLSLYLFCILFINVSQIFYLKYQSKSCFISCKDPFINIYKRHISVKSALSGKGSFIRELWTLVQSPIIST